jgi:hypothetical protein
MFNGNITRYFFFLPIALIKNNYIFRATLETAFKNSITKAISQPDVFDVKNSQHISNTIWGLAKMVILI